MTVEIAISHGKTALIDVADQHLIAGRNWYYEHGYARARIGGKRGRWVYMHRIILGSPKGAVDHINRNGLDNRRSNLRVCHQRDNSRNQSLRKNNTSGFKGVTWRRDIRKWAAKITVNRKTIDLGAHDNAADAALAYDRAAARLFGQFASLNFPSPA